MSRRRGPRAAASSPGSTAEVARLLADGVKRHQEGRLKQAGELYRRVLAIAPEQPDALHLSGLVAHAAGDDAQARQLLERAIAAAPGQAAFHNSLAVVCLEAGEAEAALAHLARALAIDPLFAEALLNRGNALQRLGRLDAAVASYDRALSARADYPKALCNRGRALHLLQRPADAVADLLRALSLRPDYATASRYLGDSLAELGRGEAARAAYGQALVAAPEEAEALAGLASLEERTNRLDEAVAAAERALARDPRQVRAALTLARVCRRQGRFADGLARLQPFADGLGTGVSIGRDGAEAAAMVAFERAMLHDRAADYEAAYGAFVDGHRWMEGAWPVTAADHAFFPDLIARLAARLTDNWRAGWTPPPVPLACDPPDPVFLVGFPRSGTTLLEQMLDAHPDLRTLEEKDAIDVVRRRVAALPGGYPDALATLSAAELADLRALYRAEVNRHLGDVPVGLLVDKMPLNSIEAALIHRLFPGARFLLALRHPADVVLSNFMQAFKPNAAMVQFASLNNAARFYAQVMGLWQQSRRVLPLAVHTVRYEDLIADVEGETRRLLAFLDMPWRDEVLAYRERAAARSIATPSYHQVVEPVYRRAIGRWRNYQPHLEEAAALPLLAPFISAFGYDDD
ncbi:MAG: sulfotransferase [Rhodospirillales bacterium]